MPVLWYDFKGICEAVRKILGVWQCPFINSWSYPKSRMNVLQNTYVQNVFRCTHSVSRMHGQFISHILVCLLFLNKWFYCYSVTGALSCIWSGLSCGPVWLTSKTRFLPPFFCRPQISVRLLGHKIQSPQEWEAVQALTVSFQKSWINSQWAKHVVSKHALKRLSTLLLLCWVFQITSCLGFGGLHEELREKVS